MEQSEELRRLKESPDYQSFNNSTQGSHQFPAEPTEHAGSLKPSARAPSMAFTQMSSELLVWCGHREAEGSKTSVSNWWMMAHICWAGCARFIPS
ncbi:hypothetical protein HispidOSU_006320 [Sigmodon hispidus]